MDSSQLHHALSLHAHARIPPSSPAALPLRTASSTPMSSPGLFSPSPSHFQQSTSLSESNTPAAASGSPYLHPLQNHRVRETHKALIDSDIITGRKSINQYEVIEEIGRGMHGKVKLARNTQTAENVAIKIIPRFSKKRRLGRVTAMSPQDKTKKEIAILKKIRHPNVVALLEVIDDPELEKIYMVLEHVELGEVVWRKKGLPHICQYERRRVEREMRGDAPTAEEEQYDQILERRQALKEVKRARLAQAHAGPSDYWSVEYGAADERSSAGPWSRVPSCEDVAATDAQASPAASCPSSCAPSRSMSSVSARPAPPELDETVDWTADVETPVPLSGSPTALDAAMHSFHDGGFRPRSLSVADSIISHMSSVDYNPHAHDPFAEDFSFVPCFTMDQARWTFRDTVLGLEYLHYQGVVHRDIKPANLLWTRDHRVRISDFGVSYFGRPIRDGEADETVSESEAQDFDDDLELAKTVGTPAFFAPELCYTDVESTEQPKVSEQIDVWSLGVTLYCLIYARIPFLAEDEFQMFRKIATDEVHISRRRLKPVDPSTSPSATSLYKRHNAHPYRDDNDLEYEEVDNLLYDLLRQMLIKNPEKRIRLRDIKRHPWVVQGIANPVGWLEDTDPALPSCGRKIQVDEKDMSFAVVPLNFLERARSAVKKAVGKVMHPLVDRGDVRSRRRAASSVASSAGDSAIRLPGLPTDCTNGRRGNLRIDDYFSQSGREGLTHNSRLAPSSSESNLRSDPIDYDPLATVLPPLGRHRDLNVLELGKSEHESTARRLHRQPGDSEPQHSLFQLKASPPEARPSPASLWCGGQRGLPRDGDTNMRRARCPETAGEDIFRSASADRALFVNVDKRAQAQVSLSNAVAPGTFKGSRRLKSMKSIDLKRGPREHSNSTPSPLSSSPQTMATTYQHGQPRSDPNFNARQQTIVDEIPQTTHRVEDSPNAASSKRDTHDSYLTENTATRSAIDFPETAESEDNRILDADSQAVDIPCPPSPGAQAWSRDFEAPSRGHTIQFSSVDSMEAMDSPLTSPSVTTSPVPRDGAPKTSSHKMANFQSDPSLPALLSGASSVSADTEGELLGKPGIVNGQSPQLEAKDSESRGAASSTIETPARDDDGSDDDILVMARPRRRTSAMFRAQSIRPVEAKRRDTSASTASNETAKRVSIHDDNGSAGFT